MTVRTLGEQDRAIEIPLNSALELDPRLSWLERVLLEPRATPQDLADRRRQPRNRWLTKTSDKIQNITSFLREPLLRLIRVIPVEPEPGPSFPQQWKQAFSPLSRDSRHFLHQKIPSNHCRNDDRLGHPAERRGGSASDASEVVAIGSAHPLNHTDLSESTKRSGKTRW